MADKARKGRKSPSDRGPGGDRGGAVDPGLSVQPPDQERGDRLSDIWPQYRDIVSHTLVRGYAGGLPVRDGARKYRKRENAVHGGGLRPGDERDGGDGLRRQDQNLPPATAADAAQLAYVSDRHWRQALTAAAEDARARLRDGDGVFDRSLALEACTDKSLEVGYQLLHLPMVGLGARDIVRVGTLKKEVAKMMLMTQVQVDDQRLRRKTSDLLPEILKRLET